MQQPHGDQRIDRIGKGTHQRCQDIHCQPKVQRSLSAKAVKQRTIQQLPDGDADQVAGERQLHVGNGSVQVGGDGGEPRQVHIDGERADGGKRSQDEDGDYVLLACHVK